MKYAPKSRFLTLALVSTVAAVSAGCAANPVAPSALPASVSEQAAAKHCLLETGTRIDRTLDQCGAVPGRVYTREDLERTGGINLADSLKRLDPRL